MIEDKLTHDERVRLECIAQANVTAASTRMTGLPSERVLEIAAKYERFVRGGGGEPS